MTQQSPSSVMVFPSITSFLIDIPPKPNGFYIDYRKRAQLASAKGLSALHKILSNFVEQRDPPVNT
jgi:hypothetical protein